MVNFKWMNILSLLLFLSHNEMLTIVRASWQASNGSWYKMNDSLVNKVELSEVLLQKAYLLFYNRSTGAAGSENKEPSDGVDMQSGNANR